MLITVFAEVQGSQAWIESYLRMTNLIAIEALGALEGHSPPDVLPTDTRALAVNGIQIDAMIERSVASQGLSSECDCGLLSRSLHRESSNSLLLCV